MATQDACTPRKINWADLDSDDDDDLGIAADAFGELPVVAQSQKAKEADERRRRLQCEVEEAAVLNRLKKQAEPAQVAASPATPETYAHSYSTPIRQGRANTASLTPTGPHQASATYLPVCSPYTPTATPPSRKHFKCEAQQQILNVLNDYGTMDVQELSKALDWKKSYSRTLGSLYAFVKRECQGLLTYDSKGKVRVGGPAMAGYYGQEYEYEYNAMNGVVAVNGMGIVATPGAREALVEQEADCFPTTPRAASKAAEERAETRAEQEKPTAAKATTVTTPYEADATINDIARSLLSMNWN